MNSVYEGLFTLCYLMAATCHGTVCAVASAGGLALLLIIYHAPYDKDQDDKKDPSAEDGTQVLIQE